MSKTNQSVTEEDDEIFSNERFAETTIQRISKYVKNYGEKDKEDIYKLLKRCYVALCRLRNWEPQDLDKFRD